MAQLAVFVSYFDNTDAAFSEKFVTLIPLTGQTTGQVLHQQVTEYLSNIDLPIEYLISVSTDGAPAMTGRENGLEGRLRRDNDEILFVHCIIHQTVLCAKLSARLKETMTNVMRMINFLRAQSYLRHRELRTYLEDLELEHTDLLLHNEVRWLSKGRCLDRFWELKNVIIQFLSGLTSTAGQTYYSLLRDDDYLADMAFLKDLFTH
jgi:hypothetical protein